MVVERFFQTLHLDRKKTLRSQHQKAIGIILANAYFCWENTRVTLVESASLFNRNNKALPQNRYNSTGVGIRPFRYAVDLLEKAGFLICTIGFKGRWNATGIASTFRPSKSLIAWFKSNTEDLWACPTSQDRELICLKKEDTLVDYSDFPLQRKYREELQLINSVNAKHTFSYQEYQNTNGTKIPSGKTIRPAPIATEYQRYFNEGWTTGGRLYSSLSSISKNERRSLRIDGEPTVELDYGSLHLRLMYSEASVIAPDSDLYTISTYPREIMKMVALRVANCQSRNAALHSIVLEGHSKETADEMLTSFEKAHSAIADQFYSEFWRIGMFIESCIGIAVMTHFAKSGKPIINIHDGFRVKAEDEQLLRQCMNQYYIREVSQRPVIDYD